MVNLYLDSVMSMYRNSREDEVTISLNRQVQTDRTIPNNKLDVIISVVMKTERVL